MGGIRSGCAEGVVALWVLPFQCRGTLDADLNRIFTCAGCGRQFFEMPPYRRLQACSQILRKA